MYLPVIECFNYGEDSDKKRNSQGGQFLPSNKLEIRFPAVLSPTQNFFSCTNLELSLLNPNMPSIFMYLYLIDVLYPFPFTKNSYLRDVASQDQPPHGYHVIIFR